MVLLRSGGLCKPNPKPVPRWPPLWDTTAASQSAVRPSKHILREARGIRSAISPNLVAHGSLEYRHESKPTGEHFWAMVGLVHGPPFCDDGSGRFLGVHITFIVADGGDGRGDSAAPGFPRQLGLAAAEARSSPPSWCALVVGALRWRPHVLVTGAAGTGKTTLEKLVDDLLGWIALSVSAPTEAGIRQLLTGAARPVIIDEMETENAEQARRVIGLMRLASTGSRSAVVRGAPRAALRSGRSAHLSSCPASSMLTSSNRIVHGSVASNSATCRGARKRTDAPRLSIGFLLIRDTLPVGMYVLNMFCRRGSRLWGSRLHRACVV